MADDVTTVGVDFKTKALEIAVRLTHNNPYAEEGQDYAEARAKHIYRVLNILMTGEATQARPRTTPVVGPGSVLEEDGNFKP